MRVLSHMKASVVCGGLLKLCVLIGMFHSAVLPSVALVMVEVKRRPCHLLLMAFRPCFVRPLSLADPLRGLATLEAVCWAETVFLPRLVCDDFPQAPLVYTPAPVQAGVLLKLLFARDAVSASRHSGSYYQIGHRQSIGALADRAGGCIVKEGQVLVCFRA